MVLQLVDIHHRYGRRPSLHAVTLTVQSGDCYGFIGHNGAGKTTTLRIALGLDRPTRGQVLIDGFDAFRHPREARARTGGMIESTGFYPWVNARDNLVSLGRLQGMRRREAIAAANRWLDEVGLAADAHRRIGTFSQGMRQRLGLAQALLGEPRYILLDEPQNGLDPEGIAELREVIRRLTEAGMTVLLSSHQLNEVTGLCNRVGVLRRGRLLVEDETDRLLAAARHRYLLDVDDRVRTQEILDRLGVSHARADDGELTLELESVEPRELLRTLVGEEIGVNQFAPRPTTLEEVYLRLTGRAPAESDRTEPPPEFPELRRPDRSTAPRHPTARMVGYDVRRNALRWPVLIMLAIPAFLAWRRIHSLAADHGRYLGEIAAGKLFSTSTLTAFEAIGRGVAAAVPALTVIMAAIASQSIAGDRALGTLRNVLLRPLCRFHVSLGKALAVVIALLVAYGALLAVSFITANAHFEFSDRYEITRDGPQDLWIEAVDVWPYVLTAMASPLLSLLAYAGIGFLVGTIMNRSMWALALSLSAVLVLDMGRAIARPAGFESWLPSAYISSPLGDTSYIAFYNDLSIGSAEAYFTYLDTAWIVPGTWCLLTFLASALVLWRKRVP